MDDERIKMKTENYFRKNNVESVNLFCQDFDWPKIQSLLYKIPCLLVPVSSFEKRK